MITESLREDVIAIFESGCVIRAVEKLALTLLRQETLSGPEVEALIVSQITEEQRNELRHECHDPLTEEAINAARKQPIATDEA